MRSLKSSNGLALIWTKKLNTALTVKGGSLLPTQMAVLKERPREAFVGWKDIYLSKSWMGNWFGEMEHTFTLIMTHFVR